MTKILLTVIIPTINKVLRVLLTADNGNNKYNLLQIFEV